MQLMDTSSFSLALVLLILSSVILATSSSSSTDQDALIAFRNGIVSDPHGFVSNNWSTSASICSWTGVSCSVEHQRVTALNLSGFFLEGTISPYLGNLTFLQSLDISSNNFTGSIPSELFINIPGLQSLNLSGNQLDGGLPSGIFTNMSELIGVDLRFNKLSGELPSDLCSNTPKLKRLLLRENQLSGKIPTSLYKCREMEDLRLSHNQFIGNIPTEIGNLTMLTYLSLNSNNLEGKIPSSISNISALEHLYLGENILSGSISIFNGLTKLRTLDLHTNNFIGHIPNQIGNLTQLKLFHVQRNKLTGELPGELGHLKNMEFLKAFENGFLSGSIPPSIFNISTLKKLDLHGNQFSGSLPPGLGLSLLNLEDLYLHSNRLSGQIPTTIANASMLVKLELSTNSFSGSIPDFGNLRSLEVLRLWGNNLTGAESPNQELTFLSSLVSCRDLINLELSDNPVMNGILPPSVGNLSTSLFTFTISNCSIHGVIPSGFGNLSGLQTLDLSENQLTGVIPETIGELKEVRKLYLCYNHLQGYIPPDLCRMSNLMNLYLCNNRLTGLIPGCLGAVESVRRVSLASNKLNSTLPSSLFNLKDLIFLDLSSNYLSGRLPEEIGSLRAINSLDLSYNKLSGHIPNSIDGCQSLEYLYLSNNMLDGSIPQTMGKVKGLRTLQLSNNHLSGSIPESLEELKLELFNVSYNRLEGEIPDKGCFANFSAESFLNNSALCGPQRFQVPSCARSRPRSIVDLVMKYVVLPFVAFMFVAVGVLVLLRRRRPREKPLTTETPLVSPWKIVSEKELEQGTESFSEMNLLGRGGIGSVYKATLADGTHVAVKVFNLQVEGATNIFDNESRILGTIRHRNLVKTLGCCSNSEFKALILAYMPNGSLDKWLLPDRCCLDLVQRLRIAIDVALALEYLHHDHTHTVVHCDVKPSNVLLDADMTAHVCDFGIAKLFDKREAAVHAMTMATIGYAAPEFGSEGKVSTSGDVYSYGILLLEMFTSKKPTDEMFSGEMSIKDWVKKALQEKAVSKVVASGLLSREDPHFSANLECITSIFELAMKCLAFSPVERINMMQVVVALQKIKANFAVKEIQTKRRN